MVMIVPGEAPSIKRPMIEVLAGLNLPMLVKLARNRPNAPLDTLVVQGQDAGRKYINIASRILAG